MPISADSEAIRLREFVVRALRFQLARSILFRFEIAAIAISDLGI